MTRYSLPTVVAATLVGALVCGCERSLPNSSYREVSLCEMTKYAESVVVARPTSTGGSASIAFPEGNAEMTPVDLRFDEVLASSRSLAANTTEAVLLRLWVQRDGSSVEGPLKDSAGVFRSGIWFLARTSVDTRPLVMTTGYFWTEDDQTFRNVAGQRVTRQQILDSWATSRQAGHVCETEPPTAAP